jgi:SAF domain
MSRQSPAGVGTAYFPATDVPPNGNAALGQPSQLRRLPRRRRPAMVALALALAGAGVLVSAAAYQQVDHRVPVVVITAPVPAFAVITASDVGVADVSVPSAVHVIPGSQLSQVTGQIAAVTLRPGTLLAPADLTVAQPPGPGQVLVPVPIKPESLPASGLAPGDHVLIVATPGDQGQAGSSAAAPSLPAPVAAQVEAVSAVIDQQGYDVVDLLVAAAAGPSVAEQASTGQFALIVIRRGG